MTILKRHLSESRLFRHSLLALLFLLPVGAGLLALAEGRLSSTAHSPMLITGLTLKDGELTPITAWSHIVVVLIGLSVALADQIIRLVAPGNCGRDNR